MIKDNLEATPHDYTYKNNTIIILHDQIEITMWAGPKENCKKVNKVTEYAGALLNKSLQYQAWNKGLWVFLMS